MLLSRAVLFSYTSNCERKKRLGEQTVQVRVYKSNLNYTRQILKFVIVRFKLNTTL